MWCIMLIVWLNMNTPCVPMMSKGCVCHANITSSLNKTWCGFHIANTSAHEFCGGFLCRTWGICHCRNWLRQGIKWRCHYLWWSSMAWSFILVHSIGHARPIGCRWNMHFIAYRQHKYMWNPHLAGWPHEVLFYKYYLQDSRTRVRPKWIFCAHFVLFFWSKLFIANWTGYLFL